VTYKYALIVMALCAAAASAQAHPSHINSDEVLPNSPFKELGMPDAGEFNPVGDGANAAAVQATPLIPAAQTYYPPAIVITERPVKPYALVAAPTLPCAPGYCPRSRPRRADRN
jgi:hypothetical protein